MIVRKAKPEELDRAMQILDIGRKHMRSEGNDVQWTKGYPSTDLIRRDIEAGQFFVWLEEEKEETDGMKAIHGVFSFIVGEDPTYGYIENGSWLNENPYGTIHRMASDGTRKGMLQACLAYCRSIIPEIRVDTHEKNLSTQGACEKLGFQRCGVIYVADGTPRIAYQLPAASEE